MTVASLEARGIWAVIKYLREQARDKLLARQNIHGRWAEPHSCKATACLQTVHGNAAARCGPEQHQTVHDSSR